MDMSSTAFVNRDKELMPVRQAVETLQDEQQLLRTPLIEFSGVQGIGKSTLLQKVKEILDESKIENAFKDAKQIVDDDFKNAALQVKTRPFALILDALDAISSEQLQIIETELGNLIESNRFFVVFGSKYVERFEHTRSITRKLKVFHLEPLEREYCLYYLNNVAQRLLPQTREIIYDWTRGYPLAMRIMTEKILYENLDPTVEEDRKRLVQTLIQEVIAENLLASAPSVEERTRLQTLLALLSVPRRFNLILTEDLIKKFAPQYALVNSLAYITLPKDVNDVTNVLSWSLERVGYCIDEPIRNLFLLQYKIENQPKLIEIHAFLANKNRDFAQKVSGSDHIHYLREFFYHLACSKAETEVRAALEQHLTQLLQFPSQSEQILFDTLVQFYREFQRDQELQEAIGQQNTNFVYSFLYRRFLEIYKQLPEEMRGDRLKVFFSLIAQRSSYGDFDEIFEVGLRLLSKQIAKDEAITFYNELIQDKELENLLGEKFHEIDERIRVVLTDEGS